MTTQELIARGYRRVSRRFGHVARVDRPDWREELARRHSPWDPEGEGMRWVNALGDGAADFYRRGYSKDVVVLSQTVALRVLPSAWDTTGYVEAP